MVWSAAGHGCSAMANMEQSVETLSAYVMTSIRVCDFNKFNFFDLYSHHTINHLSTECTPSQWKFKLAKRMIGQLNLLPNTNEMLGIWSMSLNFNFPNLNPILWIFRVVGITNLKSKNILGKHSPYLFILIMNNWVNIHTRRVLKNALKTLAWRPLVSWRTVVIFVWSFHVGNLPSIFLLSCMRILQELVLILGDSFSLQSLEHINPWTCSLLQIGIIPFLRKPSM